MPPARPPARPWGPDHPRRRRRRPRPRRPRSRIGALMKELVEYIAKALVDNPDEVSVTEETNGPNILLELRVGEGDMGRVIGRQGRGVNGIPALGRVNAARQANGPQPRNTADT